MSSSGHPPYQRPARQAITELPASSRASWRLKYLFDVGGEERALALLKRAEAHLAGTGQPATIRTLWMLLADRAGLDPDDIDMRAAAALAGIAMGLGEANPAAEAEP